MRLLALVFSGFVSRCFFCCSFLGGSFFSGSFFSRSIGSGLGFFLGSLLGFFGFSDLGGLFFGAFLGGFARFTLLGVVARCTLQDTGGIEEAMDAVRRLRTDGQPVAGTCLLYTSPSPRD